MLSKRGLRAPLRQRFRGGYSFDCYGLQTKSTTVWPPESVKENMAVFAFPLPPFPLSILPILFRLSSRPPYFP
jgi:hypothetical protein